MDRYFSDKIVIEQLEDKLTIIREERNKIAHIKHYYKKDFDEDKQILSGFNVKLEEATRSIEVSDLTAEGIDAITTFSSFLGDLLSISSSLSSFSTAISALQASEPKTDLFPSLSAFQASVQASVPKTDLFPAISALQAIVQASLPKTDLFPAISALQASVQASVPKTDLFPAISALQAGVQASMPKTELQGLRTFVLKKENKDD